MPSSSFVLKNCVIPLFEVMVALSAVLALENCVSPPVLLAIVGLFEELSSMPTLRDRRESNQSWSNYS